jgi:hypothetical protein
LVDYLNQRAPLPYARNPQTACATSENTNYPALGEPQLAAALTCFKKLTKAKSAM